MNVSRPVKPPVVSRALDFNDKINGSSPELFRKKSSRRMSLVEVRMSAAKRLECI